eukprot:m.1393 g.1393  ORF g.1393 m.1393 type:complete len:659 (+) comp947_c0_seq1:159-2135(+)
MDFPSDLDSALELVTKLRVERDTLRADFEELRVVHLEKQQENAALRLELSENIRLREESQRQHEAVVATWETELESRAKDIAELQQKILSQEDIELLRVRLIDELEAPHQELAAHMEQEVQKFRGLYHKARRDYELLREQHEHQRDHSQQFEDALTKLRQAEVEDLRVLVEKLKAEASDSKTHLELRKVKRELTAAELTVVNLTAEIDELHAVKETSTREFDQAMRLKDRANHELTASTKVLQGDVDSLRLHVSKLQDELTATLAAAAQAKTDLHHAEQRAITLQSEHAEAAHALRAEISDLKINHAKSTSTWDRERRTLEESVGTAQRLVATTEAQLTAMEKALAAKDEECAARLHAAREDAWEKHRELENDKSALEAQVRGLERDAASQAATWRTREDELVSENRQLQKTTDSLQASCRDLQRAVDDGNATAQDQAGKIVRLEVIETEYTALQAQAAAQEKDRTALQRNCANLTSQLAVKDAEIAQIQDEMDAQRVNLRREADELRTAYNVAVSTFEKKGKEVNDDSAALFQRFLALAECHKAYKKKSRVERKNLQELVATLEEKLTAMATSKRELGEQYRRTHRQLMELQRKVDEYKAVIANEGARAAAGVEHPPHGTPAVFDTNMANRNRAEIRRLKEEIDEHLTHDVFNDDAS